MPVVEVEFEVLPLAFDPELPIARTACHQAAVEFAVLVPLLDADGVPAGVPDVELGLVLAAVFNALCVLAVPPLTVG